MIARWIYWPSLLIAAFGGAVVVISATYESVREEFAGSVALLTTTVAILLFLRMLFDPKCHRGIRAANQEMTGQHGVPFRLTPLLHPQWGLFGSRAGSPLLLIIRAVLAVEIIVVMLLLQGSPLLLLLAFASFGVVMMLSLLQVAGSVHSTGQ